MCRFFNVNLYKTTIAKLAIIALFLGCATSPKQKISKLQFSPPITRADLDYVFLKSQLLIYSGEEEKALALLDEVLFQKEALRFDVSDLQIMAARIELKQQKYFEANRRYEALLSDGYDDVGAVEEVARFYYLSEQSEKALELYDHLVNEEPDNENHWIYKGLLHTEAGDFEQAWDAFSVLIEKSSKVKHLGYYYLAKLMRGVGDTKKSVYYYKQCAENKADFSPCAIDLSEIYISDSNSVKAEDLLEDFNLKYQDETVLKKLSSIYLKNGDFKKASKHLLSLERILPQDIDLKRKLALALIQRDNYSGAVSRLKLISRDPSATEDDHLNTIRILEFTEGGEKAVNFTNQIVQNSKVSEKTFFKLYELNKRLKKDVNKNCDGLYNQKKSMCLYAHGILFMTENKIREAENHLKKSLSSHDENFKARYLLGRLYEDFKNDKKSALVEINKSLAINPNYSAALNYLAYTWAKENIKIDTAVEYIQRALAQNPKNGQFLDTYGYLLYRQKKYDSALLLLTQALKFIPNNPDVYEHIADVHSKLKNQEKALRFYKLASKLFKGEDRKRVGGKVARIEQKSPRSVSSADSSGSSTGDRMPAAVKTHR